MTVLTIDVVGASDAGAGRSARGATDPPHDGRTLRDVLHSPPLLVTVGERVQLTYEVVCLVPGRTTGFPASCTPRGSVFVRRAELGAKQGQFVEIPLAPSKQGALWTTLPASYASGAGFDYYAVVEDGFGGATTLPTGAPAVTHRAWVVADWTDVDLGTHSFGAPRAPDRTLLSAAWGESAGRLGLDDGAEQSRIGPSAFDVAPDRTLIVLDQVNDRLAIRRPQAQLPVYVPIPFAGGEGDIAVGSDETIYVLDQGGAGLAAPAIRSVGPGGHLAGMTPLADRSADMVRVGPAGPLVHSYPSEMWLPTGSAAPLPTGRQLALARNGRAVPGGRELIVRASQADARLAIVSGHTIVRAWRVTSATPLGEVQLVEPRRDGLLAIVRVWTERRAEFRVLELTASGLGRSFSLAPSEWAETAPLSRFRLEGGVLYQLRSSPAGAEIVTFEIGEHR